MRISLKRWCYTSARTTVICDKCQGLRILSGDEDLCINCGKRWTEPFPMETLAQSAAWWKRHDLRRGKGVKAEVIPSINTGDSPKGA